MSFRCRLVPKSVTLNDLERRNSPYLALFAEFGSFRGALCKSVRVRCRRKKVHVRYLIPWQVSC